MALQGQKFNVALDHVFRHMQPSNGCLPGATAHPCKLVVEGIWLVLSRSLHLYQDAVRLTERTLFQTCSFFGLNITNSEGS